MQNPTRVLLCRLGVIAFCLLPTTVVGGWIVHRTSGRFSIAQKAEWERELTSRLGLIVEIESVAYPGPAHARLTGPRLLDPETRALVAAADAIDVHSTAAGWQIEAWQPRIEANQLPLLHAAVDERLLRSPGLEATTCELTSRDLTILGGEDTMTLVEVTARLESTPTGPALLATFRLPNSQPTSNPLTLTIHRDRQISPPQTRWQLDTAGHALPCGLLAAIAPNAARFGPHCRFAGSFVADETAAGLSCEAQGILSDADLDALVTEHFPHQLSGLARIQIDRASIETGRLTELCGFLQAQNGAVSHSLLAAAQEHLHLELADNNPSIQPGRPVAFRQLSIGFALRESRLTLTGNADPAQPGVLLANAAGPLLIAPPQHSAPAISLLRTLLPGSEHQVPATRQTDALVRLFPLPDIAPTRIAEREELHIPTRLVPSSSISTPPTRQPKMR